MSDKPSLTPHIVISDAKVAIDFYKAAFGAVELFRHPAPGTDKLLHAHLVINGADFLLHDDFSTTMGQAVQTTEALGGCPVTFDLRVPDADAAWARAVAAGAQVKMPLADQFWGDRYGQLRDPFGFYWSICQSISKPTPEEIEEGAKAAMLV
jgi:PhnB protein